MNSATAFFCLITNNIQFNTSMLVWRPYKYIIFLTFYIWRYVIHFKYKNSIEYLIPETYVLEYILLWINFVPICVKHIYTSECLISIWQNIHPYMHISLQKWNYVTQASTGLTSKIRNGLKQQCQLVILPACSCITSYNNKGAPKGERGNICRLQGGTILVTIWDNQLSNVQSLFLTYSIEIKLHPVAVHTIFCRWCF